MIADNNNFKQKKALCQRKINTKNSRQPAILHLPLILAKNLLRKGLEGRGRPEGSARPPQPRRKRGEEAGAERSPGKPGFRRLRRKCAQITKTNFLNVKLLDFFLPSLCFLSLYGINT
jgi:hypothetical protein